MQLAIGKKAIGKGAGTIFLLFACCTLPIVKGQSKGVEEGANPGFHPFESVLKKI